MIECSACKCLVLVDKRTQVCNECNRSYCLKCFDFKKNVCKSCLKSEGILIVLDEISNSEGREICVIKENGSLYVRLVVAGKEVLLSPRELKVVAGSLDCFYEKLF